MREPPPRPLEFPPPAFEFFFRRDPRPVPAPRLGGVRGMQSSAGMTNYRVPNLRHTRSASAVYRQLPHELSAPLHAIVGSAEMLVDETRRERRQALVQAIYEAVGTILELEERLMRTARRPEGTDLREAPRRRPLMPEWTHASGHSSSAA